MKEVIPKIGNNTTINNNTTNNNTLNNFNLNFFLNEQCKDALADAIWVQITNARDLHARLLQQHLRDAAAHRAKSPNCYPDIPHTVPPAVSAKKIEVMILYKIARVVL